MLMIAGVPLERKEALATLPPNSKPSGCKPPASKKKSSPKEKGKVDNSPLQEEAFQSRPSVRIVIPDHLKSLLVDDWENVTKNLSLVPLPSPHPVNEILTTYFDEEKGKRRLGSAEADLLEEVVSGVKEYFEKCLGRILLYRFEREQFFEIRQLWEHGAAEWEGKGAGDVYGAEHLCRLFGEFDFSSFPFRVYDLLPVASISDSWIPLFIYFRSLHARTHRANQHGPAIGQPTARGTSQAHPMAGQELGSLLHHRVRDRQHRVHRKGAGELKPNLP